MNARWICYKIGDSIMKTKYYIYLTAEERWAVINSLIDLRNDLISRGKYTDLVDELLIRISKAKAKKIKIKGVWQWRLHIHVKEIICCRI